MVSGSLGHLMSRQRERFAYLAGTAHVNASDVVRFVEQTALGSRFAEAYDGGPHSKPRVRTLLREGSFPGSSPIAGGQSGWHPPGILGQLCTTCRPRRRSAFGPLHGFASKRAAGKNRSRDRDPRTRTRDGPDSSADNGGVVAQRSTDGTDHCPCSVREQAPTSADSNEEHAGNLVELREVIGAAWSLSLRQAGFKSAASSAIPARYRFENLRLPPRRKQPKSCLDSH
jgi:hypothetical protein